MIAAMRFRALVLASSIACQGGAAPPPPPKKGSAELEVIRPGAQPRLLRYHATKGATVKLELVTEVELKAGSAGTPTPTLVLDFDLVVVDVAADGSARLRMVIVDASFRERDGVDAARMTALASKVGPLAGVAIVGTLAPDGKLRDAAADVGDRKLPKELADQLPQLVGRVEQLALPLPSEPVGAGGRWRSTRELRQNGLATTTTTIVDVTALDGDQLAVALTSDVRGADQDAAQTGGTTVRVHDVHGTGTGHGTIDLGRLVFAGELALDLHADVTAQAKTDPIAMKLRHVVTLR